MRKAPAVTLIFGLLIVAALTAGCNRGGKSPQANPEGVVEAFIISFQQKNLEAMSALYYNRRFSSEEEEFLSKLFTVIEIKEFAVEEVVLLSEKEAEVKTSIAMIIYNREKTARNTFRVIKKERLWYLSSQL